MSKQSAVVLAAISPLTAQQVGKGLALAASRAEGAQVTLMATVCATVALIGMPVTASQYVKQLGPSIAAGFKQGPAKRLPDDTVASYKSRFKTAALAMLSDLPELQPVAGENLRDYVSRVAEPLASAKLADGRQVWDVVKQGKPAKAAGTRSGKSGHASGGPTSGGSQGSVNDDEGGLNIKPAMAAAMILTHQNASRAQRLVVVMQSYAEDFDRWTSTILTDADKAELVTLTAPKPDEHPKVATPPAPIVTPQTAMASALIEGQKRKNASRRVKAA